MSEAELNARHAEKMARRKTTLDALARHLEAALDVEQIPAIARAR